MKLADLLEACRCLRVFPRSATVSLPRRQVQLAQTAQDTTEELRAQLEMARSLGRREDDVGKLLFPPFFFLFFFFLFFSKARR